MLKSSTTNIYHTGNSKMEATLLGAPLHIKTPNMDQEVCASFTCSENK